MRLPATLILLAGLLVAADSANDNAAREELKKLSGVWVMVSGERDGQKIDAEHVAKSKITWNGAKCRVETPHQSKEPIEATVTLDPSKRPRHMDWVRSVGPHAGKTHHAIYEFVGKDQYRVCFAPPGKDRPTEFKTSPGSGHMLHVWKRAKPE